MTLKQGSYLPAFVLPVRPRFGEPSLDPVREAYFGRDGVVVRKPHVILCSFIGQSALRRVLDKYPRDVVDL